MMLSATKLPDPTPNLSELYISLKAMLYAAQTANCVNSLFLTEFVRLEYDQGNLYNLLSDGLQLPISGIRNLQCEGIASRRFPGVSPVGIGERENGLCT